MVDDKGDVSAASPTAISICLTSHIYILRCSYKPLTKNQNGFFWGVWRQKLDLARLPPLCLFPGHPFSEPALQGPVCVVPALLEKEVESFGSHFTLVEQFREGSTFTPFIVRGCWHHILPWPVCACFLPFCQDSSLLLGGICWREGGRKRARKSGRRKGGGGGVCQSNGLFVNERARRGMVSSCP